MSAQPMSTVKTSKSAVTSVPWPRTSATEERKPSKPRRESWRTYCDRRYQECIQHAKALEYLLSKYPEQRCWLERHGFDVEKLLESLRWYPAEELETLDNADPVARSAEREKLRYFNQQNYERMEENLLRRLPLIQELQGDIKSLCSSGMSDSERS